MPKSRVGSVQRARISVCMIVRDEARVLERCLDSLDGLYDELCIVDTGSQDATLEIAERFHAKIQIYTRCNGSDGKIVDFSAARNASLAMASGDWVLQIDADEVLQQGHARIRMHANRGKFDQIGICLGSDGAKWVSCRLFSRTANTSYRSRIHEYLVHDGSFQIDQKIVIENIQEKKNKESSSERNIRLLLLASEEEPMEARNFHYLGNEYRQKQQFGDAIACYNKALALGNFTVGLFHTSYYLSICHFLCNEWELALDAGFRAIRVDPCYAEGYCLLADIYSKTGQIAFARQWYLVALTCKHPPSSALLGVQAWAYGSYPKTRLKELSDFHE